MKKHLATTALLLTVVPLVACGPAQRPEWMGGEPVRPAADVKVGPRRAPVLQKMPVTPLPPPPPPSQDYYMQEQAQMPPPPPPPAPAKPAVKPADNVVRKPFTGDSAAIKEMAKEVVQPVSPSPVVEAAPIPESLKPRPAEQIQKPEEPAPQPIAEDTVNDSPPPAEDKKPEEQPYPKLSDVPEKPTEFEQIKNLQAGKMEEMKEEHDAARQQQESLAAEPTQTAPAKPEPVKPKAEKPAKAKKEPKKKPEPKKKEEPVKQPEATPEPNPSEPKMSFPPGKYEDQLQQEQTLY